MSGAMQLPNLRRRRAAHLTARIMQEINPVLSDDCREAVHDRLYAVFYGAGASILTEDERQDMGLDPRDESGWTEAERSRVSREFMEAMLSTPSVFADLKFKIVD